MIPKLTWRNLWRNRRRTLITMASVTFAVMLAIVMKSLQNGVFDNLIKNVVSFYSGYLQIHQKGYWDEQVIDNSFVQNDSLLNKIQKISAVETILPRLESYTLVSAGTTTRVCLIVGTDPQKEDLVTDLRSKLIKGGYLESSSEGVMMAEKLAERLGFQPGDTLVLLGQGFQGIFAAAKFPILGILHFGSPQLNESLVYMTLAKAREFLGAEQRITSLVIGISDLEMLNQVRDQISSDIGDGYEVMTWSQMMPDIENHIRADAASLYIFSGILYLIIGFGIFSTLLMMTTERKFEMGMLLAIGMQKLRIGWMLLMETLLISLVGTLAGLALSLPVVLILVKHPIRFSGEIARAYEQFGFEAIFPALLEGRIFLTQASIVLIIALIIGLYPIWKIHRLNVVSAMKK